jgi:hypothetical protein
MTIPQEILDAVQSTEEPTALHNWMYSFSPGRLPSWVDSNFISEIGIWLVGYCKFCDKTCSVPVPLGSKYQEAEAGIPKTGCVVR